MGFLTSGDGARFAALDATRFVERFAQFPRRMRGDEWKATVEAAGESEEYGLSEGVVARDDGDVVLGPPATDIIAEACLASCGVDRLRGDLCYGDLGQIFESLRLPDLDDAARSAWTLLRSTLAPTGVPEPWWVTARFSRRCAYGWLDPPRVALVARAVETTGIAEIAGLALLDEPTLPSYAPDDLPRLAKFLVDAARRGDWVIGAEWR